jgi:hypothetical protein
MNPRSSTVTMAAGLVSICERNLCCPPMIIRGLRTSSATKRPQPARVSASRVRWANDLSRELKSSARTAHDCARQGDRSPRQEPCRQHDRKQVQKTQRNVRFCPPSNLSIGSTKKMMAHADREPRGPGEQISAQGGNADGSLRTQTDPGVDPAVSASCRPRTRSDHHRLPWSEYSSHHETLC